MTSFYYSIFFNNALENGTAVFFNILDHPPPSLATLKLYNF